MNILQQIYPGDAVASFVIRVLTEITLVTLVALGFGRIVARRNPALRHGVCVCALICVLAAPMTTWCLQRLGWSTLQISLEHERRNAAPILPSGAVSTSQIPIAAEAPFWTLERARSAASLTILVWLAGTGMLLFRLGTGMRRVSRLRSSARAIDHPTLTTAMDHLQGVWPTPLAPIRFSSKLHSPVVVGPRHATVILPEKLLDQLDEQQLCCVLAHELTHVRQRDPLVGLVQRVVEAGYWPHPFVHMLNRDLVRAREEVCDNAALNCTSAPQYADTLLTVALGITRPRAALPGAIGLMTRPWRLEERVKGLLDPHRRLTTTMNTRHLALMAISLATGTAIIGGARIVAAPVPVIHQDTVELFAHYNPKTKQVVVIQKAHKQTPAKAVRVSLKKSPAVKAIRLKLSKGVANFVKLKPIGQKVTPFRIVETTDPYVFRVQSVEESHPKSVQTTVTTTTQSDPSKSKDGQWVVTTSNSTKADPKSEVTYEYALTPSAQSSKHSEVLTYSITGDVKGTKLVPIEVKTADPMAQKPGPNATFIADPSKLTIVQVTSQSAELKGATALSTQKGDVNVFELKAGAKDGNRGEVVFAQSSPTPQLYRLDVSNPAVQEKRVFATQTSKLYQAPLGSQNSVKIGYVYRSANPFVATPAVKVKPTTVYIQGESIKIVGDNIKVVVVKPQSSTQKPVVDKKNPKQKTKG